MASWPQLNQVADSHDIATWILHCLRSVQFAKGWIGIAPAGITSDASSGFQKGVYSPQAQGDLELEQNLIRKLLLKLLSGDNALKMEVTSFPLNEDIANAQVTLQKAMSEAFAGRGALNVIVKNAGTAAS